LGVVSSNVDFVRAIYAEWEHGDWSSANWADPEIEFEVVGGLNEGRWKGLKEMAESWSAMLRTWQDLRAVPDEIRELDDDRVLVFLRNEGRGKGSGIDLHGISAKSANVFTIREGRVTRLVLYWERDLAIGDLGLAADRESQDT
jgi:ketosteroid isomerase-like protein